MKTLLTGTILSATVMTATYSTLIGFGKDGLVALTIAAMVGFLGLLFTYGSFESEKEAK